ncbi:unnamed protein product, partial [Mesorhabditis spiculigera]
MYSSPTYVRATHATRLLKEIDEFTRHDHPYARGAIKHVTPDIVELDLIVNEAPWRNAAHVLRIDFSGDFPFLAPRVYFPNKVCLALLSFENWRPATTLEAIILAIISMLTEPDISRAVEPAIADEFIRNQPLYLKKASAHIEDVEKTLQRIKSKGRSRSRRSSRSARRK